jgi:hypothetical protein
MPQSLHAELARAAEREEVSLNHFITSSLASAVGWRRDEQTAVGAEPQAEDQAEGGLRTALVVNLVILAIVAVVAVILLVIALRQGL